MPSRKPLSRYPTEYRDLFFRVKAQGIVILNVSSEKVAKTLRKDLYNYRLALWQDTPRPPVYADHVLLSILDDLTFKVRGPRVIIAIKESAFTNIIRTALEELSDE